MKKVNLTSREFLTLYTGVLIGDETVLKSACKKVYGYFPRENSEELERMVNNFADHIDKTNLELKGAAQRVGDFEVHGNRNVDKQLNTYVAKFEKEYGSEKVEVEIPEKNDKKKQDEKANNETDSKKTGVSKKVSKDKNEMTR